MGTWDRLTTLLLTTAWPFRILVGCPTSSCSVTPFIASVRTFRGLPGWVMRMPIQSSWP